MSTLANKRILLGITGGIAAYKCADLTRRLRDAGAEVRVMMTRAATRFITPLTLQGVSGHPVHEHLLDAEAESGMDHIELARWADVILVVPASANVIAKLAQGRADDLLTTVCLAADSTVAIAPAMNRQMWQNPMTQANITTLKKNDIVIFGPVEGVQACGETGPGRMLEPEELVQLIASLFESGLLDKLKVVVTAGPTWEPIDPVRGITNRSSGRMGYAVAAAAMEAGANVVLISGPTALPNPDRVQTVRVTTAREMYDAVHGHIRDAEIFISVAAVADYRPAKASKTKIKKRQESFTLGLIKNPDILASIAALKPTPFTVGFAAETTDLTKNARAKLMEKGVDLIAANPVSVPGIGFESHQNQLTLISRDCVTELPVMLKSRLARELIREIAEKFHAKNSIKNTRRAHRY